MKLTKRSGVAALATLGAALVAAGCGGGSSDSASAAKDAPALDLVPKSAVGYLTIDTDFTGKSWQNVDELGKAFDKDFKGISGEIDDAASDANEDDKKYNYEDDIDPWLGNNAGAALLSVDTKGNDAEMFMWVELESKSKFEDFLDDEKVVKGKEINGFDTYVSKKKDLFIGVNKKFAIFTDSADQLSETLNYGGDSITDVDGLKDVIDEAGDDSLATLVVSGAGVRALAAKDPSLRTIAKAKQLKAFQGAALSFGAEDDGFRVHGYVGSDGEDLADNSDHEVFDDLPGNTIAAVGGTNFGGGAESLADEAGKDNAQVQQAIGALSGALGVDLKQIGEAFSGEFALGVSTDDQGIGALAGGVAGAAMGGGLGGVDPSALTQSGAVTLAFSEEGSTGETIQKLIGAAGGLTGATEAPTTGTAGDFETSTSTIRGLPVTTAASKDVAGISIGTDVWTTWGEDTLADNDAYKAAWKAANGPKKTYGNFWVDFGRVAKLANIQSGEGVTPGGWVGWAESDGSNASIDLFMHVDKN